MSKQLFVGGLDWNTTSDSLRDTFETVGPIEEAKVITDRESGRSKGFGFVTFTNPSDATQAVETLNGAMIDGRSIRVNWSESKGRR